MVSPMIEVAVHVKYHVQSTKVTVIAPINAKETLSVVGTTVLQIFQKELTAVKCGRNNCPADFPEEADCCEMLTNV